MTKERVAVPYEGNSKLTDVKKGELLTAERLLKLSRKAETEAKGLRKDKIHAREEGRKEFYENTLKRIFSLYHEAVNDSISAAEVLQKEGKYGASEKAYAHAEAISKHFEKYDMTDREWQYLNLDINDWANERGRNEMEKNRRKVRDERLLKVGKYLGKRESRGLEGKTAAATAIIGLIGGLFFLSSNLTGNVIGSLNQTSSNVLGAVFFLVGIVGAFFYFKRR